MSDATTLEPEHSRFRHQATAWTSALERTRVIKTHIDDVCRLSTFEYIKGIDHKCHMGKMSRWREAGAMMRTGKQGRSSELLTPAQQREIDAHFQAELQELGSDFPYGDFCNLAPSAPASR